MIQSVEFTLYFCGVLAASFTDLLAVSQVVGQLCSKQIYIDAVNAV